MDLSMPAGTPATPHTGTTRPEHPIPAEPRPPALPPAVLDLLTAIRDHVDVPLPSNEPADERAWQRVMRQRLADLHVSLSVALDAKWVDTLDAAHEVAYIRARTAAAPVTYTLWQRPTDGGEQA